MHNLISLHTHRTKLRRFGFIRNGQRARETNTLRAVARTPMNQLQQRRFVHRNSNFNGLKLLWNIFYRKKAIGAHKHFEPTYHGVRIFMALNNNKPNDYYWIIFELWKQFSKHHVCSNYRRGRSEERRAGLLFAAATIVASNRIKCDGR